MHHLKEESRNFDMDNEVEQWALEKAVRALERSRLANGHMEVLAAQPLVSTLRPRGGPGRTGAPLVSTL
eukprot:4693015-Pyramimonas_sp.AAC.1